MDTCIYLALETVRICSILLQPVIPKGTDAVLTQLSIPQDQRTFEFTAVGQHPDEWVIVQQKQKFIPFPKLDIKIGDN